MSPEVRERDWTVSTLSYEWWFFRLSAAILGVTGALKLVAAIAGSGPVFESPDPLLLLSGRTLLIAAGVAEFAVVILLLATSVNPIWRSAGLLSLANTFLTYKGARLLLGIKQPCPCFGFLSDPLPVSGEFMESLTTWLAVLMSAGAAWSLSKRWLNT
jgi:hypothetical protein